MMRIMVNLRNDLYRNKSTRVNFFSFKFVFLNRFFMYFFLVIIMSFMVKLGFYMPLILAISMNFLNAFSGGFFVTKLIGVSWKTNRKRSVSINSGMP